MAGTLIVSNLKTDTDNSFIVRSNTGTTLFVANTTGIDVANSFASSSITSDKILTVANTQISGNIISSQITSVANTQITGNIISSQITSVANTQISGNIASSQITSNPTLYGNVSVTGVIGVGGATPSTSGAGITFPASVNLSTNANTLDDYEEGLWTPTIGGNATYYVQEGQYVKIGQLVYIFFDISINAIGTGSAGTVSGVPFAAADIANTTSSYTLSMSYHANLATGIAWLAGYIPENAATISFSGNNTSSDTIQRNGFAVFGNGARIVGAGTYRTLA